MVERIKIFATEFWGTFSEMSPFLLFGFVIAGVLSVLVSRDFVRRHLGGRGLWPTFKASVLGIPLPPVLLIGVIGAALLGKRGSGQSTT